MSDSIAPVETSVIPGRVQQNGKMRTDERAVLGVLVPRPGEGAGGASDHYMQVYEEDAHLLDTVSRFIGEGLAAGEAAVVIATKPHRDDLEQRFCRQGLDLASARQAGQYVAVDAAEALAMISVDGWPDERRFVDVVGGVIAHAGERYPRLRTFGEMVALLWAQGNEDAALRLEELWNALAKNHAFSLLCAYPLRGFAKAEHAEKFLRICAQHAHVIPTESYTTLASADECLRTIALLQQQSQALTTERLERQALMQALRHREQDLADFFDNAPMALHWVGPDGIILRVNDAELHLLGYRRDDYLGHHIAEFHADPAVSADILRRLHVGEELHDYEAQLVRKDGTIKQVLIDANVLWEQGQFIHTRCFTRDITAQRGSEEIRERLAAIVDSSDDAIIGHTLDGVITSWNRGAEQLYGYTAAEVVGQPLAFLVPPDLPDDLPQLLRRLQRGECINHYETQRLHKDGTRRHVSLTISLIRDRAGRIVGASKIARDITARKQIEQALDQAYADLERRVQERTTDLITANAALREEIAAREQAQAALLHREKLAAMGSLLASVAHELNNPLAVVVMQADLLREMADHTPMAAQAAELTEAAARCVEIVHHFLALARQQPPIRTRVDLNAIIEATMKLFTYPLQVDTITVERHLATDLPKLWADPHQLQQVVLNLVTNAHQALRDTTGPRQLTMTTRVDEAQQRVILEVADTGPGIPPAMQQRIFEPFFTTRPPGVGTGLGLPLCLGIVEGHGGTLSVESAQGRGSVFRVELPFQPLPAEVQVPDPACEPAARKKTILIVDDEAGITRALTTLLRRDGHTVESTTNGRLALEKCQSRDYELILCDLRMPELDGPGFYRELQRRQPSLCERIMFLTGDTLDPDMQLFLDQVALPRLNKPFTAAMIRQALKDL